MSGCDGCLLSLVESVRFFNNHEKAGDLLSEEGRIAYSICNPFTGEDNGGQA